MAKMKNVVAFLFFLVLLFFSVAETNAIEPGYATFSVPKTFSYKQAAIGTSGFSKPATLRLNYTCIQYDAPYNSNDVVGFNITNTAEGYFSGYAPITCDGKGHSVNVPVTALFGGTTGAA